MIIVVCCWFIKIDKLAKTSEREQNSIRMGMELTDKKMTGGCSSKEVYAIGN